MVWAPSEGTEQVLEPLNTPLKAYTNDKVILVGNFYAKSMIWGNDPWIREEDL